MGDGRYLSVCSVLMIATERAARTELYDDGVEKPITSQYELRELAKKLSLLVEPGGFFSWDLCSKLSKRYEHLNGDNRQKIARDPVPNRHAVMHGHMWPSMQGSLNTIFMTDFIFQVISLKKQGS